MVLQWKNVQDAELLIPRYFGIRNGKQYCRRCITFIGDGVPYIKRKDNISFLKMFFDLSPKQKKCSSAILKSYQEKKNTLVYAVCGAGKTEIVYQTISYALSLGQRVGFAIPRKDVVIELYPRLAMNFPFNKVVAIYGNHHDDLIGDITLLTTHQLFRFHNYFDLLIVDEIDAFPYANNEVLNDFMKNAIRGNHILMSATPFESIIKEYKKEGHKIVQLFERYHKHSIPVPVVKKTRLRIISFIEMIIILRKYIKEKKPVLLYFSSITLTERAYFWIKQIVKKGNYAHSKRKGREKIVEDFKNRHYDYLCTTTILERGITIDNLQVIVFDADSNLFSKESLVQIAGRVGRKINHPSGDAIFFCKHETQNIKEGINDINEANRSM